MRKQKEPVVLKAVMQLWQLMSVPSTYELLAVVPRSLRVELTEGREIVVPGLGRCYVNGPVRRLAGGRIYKGLRVEIEPDDDVIRVDIASPQQ